MTVLTPLQQLVDGYLAACSLDPDDVRYERYTRTGTQLVRRGETVADVVSCTGFLLSDPWYAVRALAPTLEKVRDTLPRWKKLGRPDAVDVAAGRPRRVSGSAAMAAVIAAEGIVLDPDGRPPAPGLGPQEAEYRLSRLVRHA